MLHSRHSCTGGTYIRAGYLSRNLDVPRANAAWQQESEPCSSMCAQGLSQQQMTVACLQALQPSISTTLHPWSLRIWKSRAVVMASFLCRSGHGGSIRGDDDTCSLQTTTWSGQQARTPIAVRRLGPLPPAPSPHHRAPAKPTAWLGRIAKLVALGAVVIISAAGVVKV